MIPEHLKHHIWQAWVGTQLKALIQGVSDALEVKFEDLSLKNEPNLSNINGPRGSKITKSAFMTKK